jgi:hypothetical protein
VLFIWRLQSLCQSSKLRHEFMREFARHCVAVLLVSATMTGLGAAQSADTITLTVGHPSVDGTIYKPHWAAAERSVTKDGHVVSAIKYQSHTYVTEWRGVSVCVVESVPYPNGSDQQFYEITVLDRRTTALLHIELRDGTGKMLTADVSGTRVTGVLRASREAREETLDFTLETPSYYSPFVDAAIGATQIREGQVWRVPAFTFAETGRKTEWHDFHIVGHDKVLAGKSTVDAWITEDDAPIRTRIWITMEPPYLPQVLRYLPDGSIGRFASQVISTDSSSRPRPKDR